MRKRWKTEDICRSADGHKKRKERRMMEGSDTEGRTWQRYPLRFLDQGKVEGIPVPLARITTCGMVTIEVLTEVEPGDPPRGRYDVIPTQTLRGRGAVPALTLLKLLAGRPHRFATSDWLSELMRGEMEVGALVRLDTIASYLRGLLCGLKAEQQHIDALRVLLVAYLRNGRGSGPGYQLAPYPVLWLDTDALAFHVEHGALMERMGEPTLALPFWERAYQLASRGVYLPDEPSSEWAQSTREQVDGSLRQSVHALHRLSLAEHGESGEEEAILRLRTYWQSHKTDEDALRPLMELLGKHERFGEAEEYYQQCVAALDQVEEGQYPDQRTRDIREFLRTKQMTRQHSNLGSSKGTVSHQDLTSEKLRFSEETRALLKCERLAPTEMARAITQQEREDQFPLAGEHRSYALLPSLSASLVEGQHARAQAPFISPISMRGDASVHRVLTLPISMTESQSSSEIMVPDFTTQFGIMCAQILALVQQWYGMAKFYHTLQNHVDQHIKKLDMLKPLSSLETYTLSRRSFLTTLAALPTTCLASKKQMHTMSLEVEEFLPQCAASITSCWHLSGGSHLDAIGPILDSYMPTLVAIMKNIPSYREVVADLVAQCYFLKAILAWHLQGLTVAETYCLHALQYSDIARNVNLRLTALNQHALISYYAKQFPKALARSEEASAILQRTSQEHIFPIVQGRVFMYLAAFQAQQSRADAEHTLEQARHAFALQTTLAEPVPLYADCGDASLTLWEGLTQYHLSIHDATHAERALLSLRTFGRLQSDMEIPERFRLECLTHRIMAASQCHEMSEAIDCFEAANRGSKALESRQRSAEVDVAFRVMLRRWPKEKQVQHLGTLL